MRYLILFLSVLQFGSVALGQVALNTELVGQINYGRFTNDIWGYVDAEGNEYALVGLVDGLSVVRVEATQLTEVAFVPGTSSIWRDIKTHGQYAYVTNENGLSNGMEIIDLSGLPQSVRFAGTYNASFVTAHNLYISDGFAYVCGSNGAQGVEILDLSNPEAPVRVGGWSADYFHDVFVLGDTLYASAGSRSSLMIIDLSNKSQLTLMGEVVMPDGGFVHNAWTTADGRFVMTTQENTGLTVKMWDIQDFANPVLLDEYLSSPSNLAHNTHIHGDYAYISHYGDGLRIVDISDPALLVEVGFYDTHQNDQGSFEGDWGAYPFAPSGLVYVSDEANGLFVVSFNNRRASRVRGQVVDAQSGQPLPGAEVVAMETSAADSTDGDGNFGIGFVDAGSYTLQVSATAHASRDLKVTVSEGQTQTVTVQLDPVTTGISDEQEMPDTFVLEQNFPNPFNAGTTIRYEIPAAAEVVGTIYNIAGREVKTLIHKQQPAGTYRLTWDGTDTSGAVVSSGVYLLELRVGQMRLARKMLFVQ